MIAFERDARLNHVRDAHALLIHAPTMAGRTVTLLWEPFSIIRALWPKRPNKV